MVKAVKKVPQERISGRIGEQIDDDLVPPRVDLDLDDFVTMLTNSGIPVSSGGFGTSLTELSQRRPLASLGISRCKWQPSSTGT